MLSQLPQWGVQARIKHNLLKLNYWKSSMFPISQTQTTSWPQQEFSKLLRVSAVQTQWPWNLYPTKQKGCTSCHFWDMLIRIYVNSTSTQQTCVDLGGMIPRSHCPKLQMCCVSETSFQKPNGDGQLRNQHFGTWSQEDTSIIQMPHSLFAFVSIHVVKCNKTATHLRRPTPISLKNPTRITIQSYETE